MRFVLLFVAALDLMVRSDLECRLIIDGRPSGVIKTGGELRVSLSPGEHRVKAVPVAGGAHWETTITVNAPDGQLLTIPLREAAARAELPAARQPAAEGQGKDGRPATRESAAAEISSETGSRGYWIDPQTRLMWAAADNGFGVSWSQAAYYCRSLTLGGYKDWTLPAIDDLQRLFGGPANESGYHIASPIKLTGWAWSGSPGQEPGQQWALDFGDGARASVVTGDSGLNRALCVRRTGK